ncbi:MAG: biotin/lipoyl-containing protein [Caldimonas sp.]
MKTLSDLTEADVERILGIVDRLNDIEVHLEVGDMKLHVRKFGDASLAFHGAALANAFAAPAQVQPAVRQEDTPAASMQTPGGAAAALSAVTTLSGVASRSDAASQADLLEVRAPMLGRFYRASSPSEPAYVEVGSKVKSEDTVCMIEVMKLFNSVHAGVNGTIVEIVAQNGEMVEHDAVLFRVRPQ